MVRPKTALNTSGSLTVTGQVRNAEGRWVEVGAGGKVERYKARTKHRDADGVLRDVTRYAKTKAKAEAALKAALVERVAPVRSAVMRPDMSLDDAADVWLTQMKRPDSNLSPNSRLQYAASYERYVAKSSISGLSLRELNSVPVLEGWLQELADCRGTGAAKTARSIVSNIIGLAVRYRALPHNALRDVRPAKASETKQTERDTTRAFTRHERQHVIEVAAAHTGAIAVDVVDVVWFLAGTGARISEALECVSWRDVDLDANDAEGNPLPTVRVRGTKSAHADRVLSLPAWLADRLRARGKARGRTGLVFASPGTRDRTKPRDRRNVARVIRAVLDEAGFPWATPHTFRRTVATLLDEAGQPIALAANQLGHSDPAMTARVYLGRKGSTAAAAAIL